MDKYELNNIQFALKKDWRKNLAVAILTTPAAHGAAGFLKDGHFILPFVFVLSYF